MSERSLQALSQQDLTGGVKDIELSFYDIIAQWEDYYSEVWEREAFN